MNLDQQRVKQSGIRSLGDMKRKGLVSGKADPKKAIKGPVKMDSLIRAWQKGDMTGILAGTGIGKTSLVMYIFKHILINNPEAVVSFVSLEMTATEIAEKWFKATENQPELADRFFIVENYNDDGTAKELTVTDIKLELQQIQDVTGRDLIAFAVDHLLEINNNGSTDFNPVCKELKNATVELDSHGFILAQTTKGKGIGDIPVPRDGCYGTSRYEWLMTNIISIFQPLKRVQKDCDLPVLGWQYAKIRYKNKGDKVKEGMNYLLKFCFETEDLIELDTAEVATFKMYYEKVLELRQNEEKYKAFQFDLSREIKGTDGKVVKINDTFGGDAPEDDDGGI